MYQSCFRSIAASRLLVTAGAAGFASETSLEFVQICSGSPPARGVFWRTLALESFVSLPLEAKGENARAPRLPRSLPTDYALVVSARDANLVLALAGAGDVVRRLHPHEHVHPDAERLSIRNPIVPDRSARLLSSVERRAKHVAAPATVSPSGSTTSDLMKAPDTAGSTCGWSVSTRLLRGQLRVT